MLVTEMNVNNSSSTRKSGVIPIRALIWVMLFSSTLFLYMLRTNISIILLAMVDTEGTNSSLVAVPECKVINGTEMLSTIYHNDSVLAEKQISGRNFKQNTYNWDSKLQGYILGAYFWGFVISNIPAAAVAENYGSRKCLAISFIVSSVLTLLGPLCASIHPYLLIGSRFFIGVFAGAVYPAVHCLISKWAPVEEKGKFISATLGGSLGTVVTWPLLGNIIEHISWDWAFYLTGIIVLLWTISWIFLVRDSPEEHPWISDKEKEYIVNSLSGTVSTTKRIPPYKSIVFSLPAWALCVAQFGNLWGLFFLMTAGPKFMSTVLGFDLGHTGMLSALPYLARMIAGFVFGIVGDLIVRRKLMTKTAVRKTFILLSHVVPGILLILQTLVGCEITWVIVLITLSLASNGASTITNLSNAQDLAPNFAGSIYGIANCIGSTTGFISPIIVGFLTAEHNGLSEWHTIFYIGAGVYIGCGIFFAIFGTADIQPWNYPVDEMTKAPIAVEGIDNAAFEKMGCEHKL